MANQVEKLNTVAILDIEKVNTLTDGNIEKINTLEFTKVLTLEICCQRSIRRNCQRIEYVRDANGRFERRQRSYD